MGDERGRWLETAVRAAREAGKILERRLGESREITYKGPGNIVTDADMAAQESILETIRAAFPHHAILSEEMVPPEADDGRPLWVVDPLDGTTNYSRRWPSFCVSIAVSEGGRVMAGAVYEPNLDEMFHAHRGGGAFVNGAPLRVSAVDSLTGALMSMNWPYGREGMAQAMRLLECLMPRVGTMRSVGSAALSLCHVAAGRSDIYFHPSLYAWDVAAAGLILEEAGGTLTDLQGEPWTLQSAQCLGTNSLLLEEVVEVLDDCR
jgi:myo-inositol-1(or 4)-monophosphatase